MNKEWDFLTIYDLEERIYKGSQEGGERHILTSQEGSEIWIKYKTDRIWTTLQIRREREEHFRRSKIYLTISKAMVK